MARIFPKAIDTYVRIGLGVAALGAIGTVAAFTYFSYPTVIDTGYSPIQPVPYSHKLHVGQLGMASTTPSERLNRSSATLSQGALFSDCSMRSS